MKALLDVWVVTCVQACGSQFYGRHQPAAHIYASHLLAATMIQTFTTILNQLHPQLKKIFSSRDHKL